MASVSSLDQDMRNLRLGRYTPQAAKEARKWIEDTLGERLQGADLLEGLKDGVALCRLANLALPPPGIKFKKSPMPFVQMENISHFLKACEMAPLNLPAHDRFLTVDLFEQKDPAQVLQCIGAFSRQAHAARPEAFRTTIGPAKKNGVVSPTNTGGGLAKGGGTFRGSVYGRPQSPTKGAASPSAAVASSGRAMSPSLTGGSTGSAGSNTARSPPVPVSSWTSKKDEGITNPAWNIAQYGYMGGASQGNQGISFGARRQITGAAPSVPNAAPVVRKRQQEEEEQARLKAQAEEAEERRRVERQAEEERERIDEEQRWEDETRRLREEEKRRLEEQKRQWEEQERRWKEEEEARKREEAEVQAKLAPKKQPPEKPRVSSQSILRGQTLAEYQRQASVRGHADGNADETPEQRRVRELEQQLEEARERERQYQAEREQRMRDGNDRTSRPGTADTNHRPGSAGQSDVSWTGDEREFLREQWQQQQQPPQPQNVRPPSSASQQMSTPQSAQPGAQQHQSHSPSDLPTRSSPQPATIEEVEDTEADSISTMPSRPQAMQTASSATSTAPLHKSGDATAAHPGSLSASGNWTPPPSEKNQRPYTPPQQPKASATGSVRDSPFARPQGRGAFGSVRSPFARPAQQQGGLSSPPPGPGSPSEPPKREFGSVRSPFAQSQGPTSPEPPQSESGSTRSPFAQSRGPTSPEPPKREFGSVRSPFARPAGERPSSPFARTEGRSPFARPGSQMGSSQPPPPRPADAMAAQTTPGNRTQAYLAEHSAPQEIGPRISSAQEAGDTALEQQRDRDARLASQRQTNAGGWASKSLLEREMERERERQREWEQNQKAVAEAPRDPSAGGGVGQSWDVNQYGFTGGDNQGRGSSSGSGINIGGRRQILGPRPQGPR